MKNFISLILQYNKKVEIVADNFFIEECNQVSKIDPMLGEIIEDYRLFLNGGKKLRGCLTKLGYEIFGGTNKNLALETSLIIEIVHTFFLIHDDIMDRDQLRRNNQTMHIKYSQKYGKHFGISKALNSGDIGIFLAYKLLFSLESSDKIKNEIAKIINQVFLEVGLGQTLDITYEKQKKFNEDSVLKVHRYKTADYTISVPLSMGALLAGTDENKLKSIKDFGIPVGIAFQIRDDELGMFSTEEELGKPVDSDLKEGKVTLLIVKALEFASEKDRNFLQYAHGNQKLTKEEVDRVRKIIKTGGALAYSQKTARDFIEEGKKFIPEITNDPAYQKMLTQLADFVVERQS